jgi:hypothetical protein
VTKYINFFGVGIFTKSDQNQDSQFHLFNFTILQFLAIYLSKSRKPYPHDYQKIIISKDSFASVGRIFAL